VFAVAADVDANTPPVATGSVEPEEPLWALEPPVGAYTLVGTPPVGTPPVETPPVETPPVGTPPVETPPALDRPVEMPPVEMPPALDGPVEMPPVETPPAPDVPPAWMAELPPVVGAPPVHDTYTMRVSSRR
jgi:hypothetical protein